MAAALRDGHVHLEASLRSRDRRRRGQPRGGFERTLLDCARELATAGAGAALVRFNPVAWRRRGVPFDAQRRALAAVAGRATRAWGLAMRWFVTLKREDGPREWRAAVDAGAGACAAGVVGVDVSRSYAVADAEDVPSPTGRRRQLGEAVERARESGLLVAAHCGWYDGRAELEEALGWGATRIGHGTPLRDAPDLLAELARRRVAVEVCPTAFERRTGRPLEDLPVADWLAAGVAIEVGTDHPLALGTGVRAEAGRLGAVAPDWSGASGREAI